MTDLIVNIKAHLAALSGKDIDALAKLLTNDFDLEVEGARLKAWKYSNGTMALPFRYVPM